MSIIHLNELPKYIPELEAMLRRSEKYYIKNEYATHNEYDTDKWGKLLSIIEKSEITPTFFNVCNLHQNSSSSVACLVNGELQLIQRESFYLQYRKFVYDILCEHTSQGDQVYELGCGFGQIALGLLIEYPKLPFTLSAGDFSRNGLTIARSIAREEGIDIETFECNFYKNGITTANIEPDAVFFTSYALCCMPTMTESLFNDLLKFTPKLVIHFEPCYEMLDPTTLLGLLARRYIEVNDYNRNLLSFLRREEKNGRIRLVQEEAPIMGLNPLLPHSTIVWQPVQ